MLNCDQVGEIGTKIQQSLDDVAFTAAKIKRNEKVKTLASLQSSVQIVEEEVAIDPTTLFTRLIALVMRENDVASYFEYELSSYPTSLFKNAVMRDATKSKLRDYLTKNIKQCGLPDNVVHVIDGGALLHTVKWLPNQDFEGIIAQYRDFLMATFGHCIVVFDGYENEASTKDHKHRKRGSKLSQAVTIELNRKVHVLQNVFLKNGKNKKMFIKLLENNLRESGFTVFEAVGDADTLIVKVSMQRAVEGCSVAVHADHADIFCMLMHHCCGHSYDVYFKTVKKTDGSRKSWNINDVISGHDKSVVENILFLHSWSGCDTTSGTHGMGRLRI